MTNAAQLAESGQAETGLRCLTCGRLNTARSRYCNFCGDGLLDATKAPLAPPVLALEDAPLDGDGMLAKVMVKVVSAAGLRVADISFTGGSSDPFCIGKLVGKPESQFQTKHIMKTLNPEWQEDFVVRDYELGDDLEFSVMDYDKGSAADLLGTVVLPCDKFNRTNGFEGVLELEKCGKGHKATLTVQVSVLWFEPPPPVSVDGSRLKVSIVSASGLRAADWSFGGGKSDPFCVCEVEGLEGEAAMAVRTKHISKTLDPVWGEEHELPIYETGQNLSFKVYDYDQGSAADLLGRVILPAYEFDNETGFEGDLRLFEGDAAKLHVKVQVLPPLLPDAPLVSEVGSRLKVKIVSAKGLRAADWSLRGPGTSDPFCTCEVMDNPDLKVETKHISKTLDPVWNEEHEIPIYEQGNRLLFQVFDYDRGSAADLLGRATLLCRNFDRDGGFEGDLRLFEEGTGSGSGTVAFLHVRVEVLPPLLPDAPPVSEPGSRLRVKVLSARGLRAADWALRGPGSSDPFCHCEVEGKPDLSFKTKHISKTLSPVWNHEHEVPMYDRGDALLFKVFDYDRGSSADLLGRATLPGRDFDREGGFEGELRLMESGKGAKAFLKVRVDVLPPVLEAAPPVSEPGSKLSVTILSAKGLRAADWGGKSDPFCCCEVRGKPETKFQTKHKDKTLAPVWNEDHEVDDYDHGDCLEFKVFDHDLGSSADLLGRVLLPCNYFDREGGFEGDLNLMECGKGCNASIRVRVTVLPSPYPAAEPVSEPGSRVRITMLGAQGLRAADFSLVGKGKSDPFCVCQVKGRPETKVQTKHLSKTLEPVWNETHEISDYDRGESLDFQVLDHDIGSAADLLGRVSLPSRAFDRAGGFEGEVQLKECGKGHQATLRLKIEVVSGAMFPPAPPISVEGSRLKITIVGATGLRAADVGIMGGKSDPYCVCTIQGKKDMTFKTRHINKTLAPLWNEEHELSPYTRGDALDFTVFDKDVGTADDLLGRVVLSGGDFDRKGGFEGELKLRECGRNKTAALRVKIAVLPPLKPELPAISVPGSALQVTIISAKGLRAADYSIFGGGKSDPFCICEIRGKPKTKCTTRHIDKTLAPAWNEEHEVPEYERGDLLDFAVMDYDVGSSADLLGRATLEGRDFDHADGFEGEVELHDCGDKPATLKVRIRVLLPPPEEPRASVPGSRLRVAVVRAGGLRAADWDIRGSSSDPFCKVQIKGKDASKRETAWIGRTLEPVWNEEFEIDDYATGEDLEFTVMDYDRASAADLLGRVSLAARHFDRAFGYAGTLKLRDCGAGTPSTLTVRVEVLPPLREGERVAEPGCVLRVRVLRAAGLSACAGKPDAFCACWIRGKTGTRFQTKVIASSLAPEWQEEHCIYDYEPGDRLECAVMDHDVGDEPDLLGRCSLESMFFDRHGGFRGDVALRECRGKGAALSLEAELLAPRRLPLLVTVFAAHNLRHGLQAATLRCVCHPAERPQFLVKTGDAAIADPVWNEELEIPDYVENDPLDVAVLGDSGERFGGASIDFETIHRMGGFRGDVRLTNGRGGHIGELHIRVETHEQREARLQVEAEERRARELRAQEEERRRLERERKEQQRLQEEAEERARREEEKRAAERARRRAQDLAREVTIPVLLWPSGDLLAQASLLAGSPVSELSRRVGRAAKLPLRPRIRLAQGPPLAEEQLLLDAGCCGRGQVFAEICPAILTCSADCTAKVWSAASGACELTITGHEAAVNSACATPDLKWVVTASDDSSAKVWVIDGVLRTFQVACTLEGHSGPVLSASFSPDNRFVITASEDTTAKIWRLRDGECVRTLDAQSEAVKSAEFAPDGKLVRTTTTGGVTKLWDIETGRCQDTIPGQEPTQPMTFTPDGTLFLELAGSDVEIRDLSTGACQKVLLGHGAEILWASFLTLRSPHAPMAAMSASSPQFKPALSASAALVLNGAASRTASAPYPSSRRVAA